MTITVTVEELKAFESKLVEWDAKCMAASIKVVTDFSSPQGHRIIRGEVAQKDFISKNPKPTLIPLI